MALEDSVRRHLASDVPLGVFLSGGVDSSAIANVAKRVSRDPVHSFTLAFAEQERNEGEIARAVSRAIGTQHHEIVSAPGGICRPAGRGHGQPGPAQL